MRHIRYGLSIILAMMFLTSNTANGTTASAAAPGQGTLVYSPDSLTLVNTGEVPLDIGLLIFVRDSDDLTSNNNISKLPLSFESRSWEKPLLLPAECVQLVADPAAYQPAPMPPPCHHLLRWEWDAPNATHFWQAGPKVDKFRVVAGSQEIQECEISAGRCVFALDEVEPIDSLTLTYSANTFRLINDGTNEVGIQRLMLCGESLCKKPLAWQPNGFKGTLDAGACIDLNLDLGGGVSPATPDCVGVQPVSKAFWRSAFVVVSPITAYMTNCPAALPTGPQRCVVPR